MKTSCAISLLASISITTILSAASGQAPGTGAIRGSIFDQNGRPVSSASILIEQPGTNTSRSVTSDSEGQYSIPLLAPGNYIEHARAAGFNEALAQNISVIVSETNTVDFHLAVAGGATNVEVKANQDLTDTESSTLGRAVDEKTIQALPLANRNYTQILSLSPGVLVALPDATVLGRGTQNVVANGAKTTANNIQFNGVDANNLAQNSAASDGEEVGVAVPAPDTIQEFKVQTGNYDATYGRGSGANVDVVSKSGTDNLHGTLWEFLRNDDLNANDFFAKLAKQPRPVLKQNQFGAAAGGPIVRNRMFFFGAYQGLRSSNGEGGETTVNLPQLTNDRSAATLGAQFCAYPTFAGGTQLACNGSNINPIALKLLNFKFKNGQYAIPNPQINISPTVIGQMPIGQSTFTTPASYREDQFTANVDDKLTASNTLAARVFYSHAPTDEPFSPAAATVPGWGTDEVDQNTMAVVSDTHVLNPNIVNIARAAYMRFDGVAAVQSPISTADLGTQSPTGQSGSSIPSPGISVDGLFTIGDAGTPAQSQVTSTYVLQDTLSLIRRHHLFRVGAEGKRHDVTVNAPFSIDGLMDIRTFSDFLLGLSAQQNGSPNGVSNVTLSTGSSGLFRKDQRYDDFAAFFQDDIRLTERLTVNAGVRYEIFGPPTETHGRLVEFDPTIASLSIPAGGSYSGYIAPANFSGTLPPGIAQSGHSGLYQTRYTDVSPRFGFAYRLSNHPEAVFRGGYGIYFDRISANPAENLGPQAPYSTFQFFTGAQNGPATLSSPFTPLLPALSSYPRFALRVPGGGPSVYGVPQRLLDPYTQEYNANLQMNVGWNALAEIGYVGTRSLHVPGCSLFNQALLASPGSPVNGQTTNSVNNVIQRVPYVGISPGSRVCQSAYDANFNSMQASISKHLSNGLQFLGSYTWSRNLDETSGSGGNQVFQFDLLTNDQNHPGQDYGVSDNDRTHRFVANFTYDLPSVRGASGVVRYATSHWQAAGVFVAESGTPITVIDSSAGAVYGNYPFINRAQLSGAPIATSGSLQSRVLGHYLSQGGFTSAPEVHNGTNAGDTGFGNSGVGIVRGPRQRNLDMSVERTFPVTESQGIHFRMEFFNLTNTANFANPIHTIASGPAFGRITAKSSNPRIIQVALKYQF